jgi:sugar phosphate permease
MNDNLEEQNRSEPLRTILYRWMEYLKQIFWGTLGIAGLIGVSFLFTGGFSSQAYSDRLFMSGIIVTAIGVFIFITINGTRKNLGIPTITKTEEDARKILEQSQTMRDKAEKRYDAGSLVWAIGVACLFLSVLLYFLFSAFRI